MIFRLLLLFLIIWFLIWIIRKQLTDKNADKPRLDSKESEDMIACAYCGTHAPDSMMIESAGKKYCCEEHARLDE